MPYYLRMRDKLEPPYHKFIADRLIECLKKFVTNFDFLFENFYTNFFDISRSFRLFNEFMIQSMKHLI